MKKTRRTFSREFKLSVLRELENDKSTAQICRENDIHPVLLSKWKKEYNENPETAFIGNGNICNGNARVAELERLVGKLYAENAFLKKVLANLETRLQEQRKKKYQR